jgi:hypothetical protein
LLNCRFSRDWGSSGVISNKNPRYLKDHTLRNIPLQEPLGSDSGNRKHHKKLDVERRRAKEKRKEKGEKMRRAIEQV